MAKEGDTLTLMSPNELERLAAGLRQEVADGFLLLKTHMTEKPLTVKEAAEYLRIGTSALYNRINSGAIPSQYVHKNGGTVYFFASELNQLLKKS